MLLSSSSAVFTRQNVQGQNVFGAKYLMLWAKLPGGGLNFKGVKRLPDTSSYMLDSVPGGHSCQNTEAAYNR